MPTEEESADARKIIRFAFSHARDAMTHAEYVYAPSDWDEMTEEEQTKWLDEEAETWVQNNIQPEYHAAIYVPRERGWSSSWEQGGDVHNPESWYD